MGGAEVCQLLDWDTDFFGFRVARVCGRRLTAEEADRVTAWCREQGVVCAYLLADVRLTYAVQPGPQGADPSGEGAAIRPSRTDDVPALRRIAQASFFDSRFYFDRRFPRRCCDELYATWIEKSCRRWPESVLVADQGDGVVGFVSCEEDGAGAGRIGLAAVDAAARGQNWGRHLVQAALQWFHRCQTRVVLVQTQGRNRAAQRLYQKCGFVPHTVHHWYHRWFSEVGAP